jgi:hypothetical protein
VLLGREPAGDQEAQGPRSHNDEGERQVEKEERHECQNGDDYRQRAPKSPARHSTDGLHDDEQNSRLQPK